MKKNLLFSFCMIFTLSMSAQIWEDNFDDGDVSDWAFIDADGDGANWGIIAGQGVDGSSTLASASWDGAPLTPNNYASTPSIDLTNVTGTIALSWKAYAQDQAWASEKYRVVVSEFFDQGTIDDGDVVFEETLTAEGDQVWLERTVDLTPYVGQVIYITFVHYDVTDFFRINLDDISVFASASDDAGVTSVVAPSNETTCTFTNEEFPSMTIFNFGGNSISNFNVSYSVNGGAPVIETVSEEIGAATEYVYTFTTPFDASAPGNYDIEYSTLLSGDTDVSNDRFTESFRNTDAVMTIHTLTDATGGQSWTVTDNLTGEVIATHGAYAWNMEFSDDVCVNSDGCYSFEYAGQMGAGAYLEVLIDGVQVFGNTDGNGVDATITVPALGGACAARDASASSLTFEQYAVVDSEVMIEGTVRNFGSENINSLMMSYTIDGGMPVTEEFSGLDVQPGAFADFAFTTPASVLDLTEYDVVVTVMQVNGSDDENAANNSISSELVAVSYIPGKKVVAEEATGTWCPWCPRGAVMLDMMTQDYENFIGIAVHNADPMTITAYDTGIGPLILGYPDLILDRATLGALPNSLDAYSELEAAYQDRLAVISPAAIDLNVELGDNGELTIDVNTEFVAPVSGDYRINVVITEDGVTGTGANWAQANNYAGGGQGPMAGYENLANPVPAEEMVYDHVAVALLGGFDGVEGSLPASINRGETFTETFNYIVDDVERLGNMHIVAMIIDNESSNIMNANSINLNTVSNDDLEFVNSVRLMPNPATDFANVEIDLVDNSQVRMTIFNATGQVVASKNYGSLAGKMNLPINTNDFQGGIYFVRMDIDNHVVTKKLSVIK